MNLQRYCSALTLLLLLLSASTLRADMAIDNLDQPVSIAGQWQFQTGDADEWREPQFDDSEWHTVTVPAHSPAGFEGYSGMAWYRLTLKLDLDEASVQQQLGSLGLTLGSIESAYELFVGGRLHGSVGRLPPEPLISFDKYRTYQIPRSAIDSDGRLVIGVRMWRYPGAGEQESVGAFEGPFRLGNIGDLRTAFLKEALFPEIFLAAVYLVVGLYHLLIARRNPALKEFRWFGWFALALAVYSFESSQWRYSLDISYLLHKKIQYISLYMGAFFLCHTLRRVANLPSSFFWRTFQVIFISYAALIVLVPNLDIHYLTLPSFQLLAAAWIAGVAVLMGWHGYHGNREAKATVGLMLLFFFGILNDVILPQGFLGGINILSFVFALVILLMAVLMANHYTATLLKLERTVEEHTADLRSANTQLQAATAAKSQFLANMSHELRTPMNAIIGLTHLGLKTELSEQQRSYLTTVEHSAQGLMGIIESILDFSRLEQGSLELAEETFSVAEVMARVVAISSPAAEERGLHIDSHIDGSIPDQLRGDAARLGQVLTIFTSNAIKFTEQGHVQLSVKELAKDSHQCTLRFGVTDSGAGISAAQHDQLFEAFSQADDSHTREHGGTGLGLALARDLVQLMQSEIEVESELDKGSTFSFSLNLAYLEAPAALTEAIDLTPIRGARVLLVDDSDINLQVAGELLRQEQLNFDCAENGQQAVDMVRESAYDCVLMDIQMPVLDGYAATAQIRSEARFEDLPILAMTANALPEDRARAEQAGMNAHIAKPIDPAELYRQLLTWIEPGERELVTVDPLQEAAEEADLPNELPGLAIDEGMTRVGGNNKLYRSLLADMSKQYADVGQLFEQQIGSGDTEGAAQLAHKLRGIAINLGATVVGGYAEQIELILRAGETLPPPLLVSLQEALAQLFTSIAQLQALTESPASSAEVMGQDELARLLAQLEQEISESNPAAADTIEVILPGLDPASDAAATLNNIKEALDIYDFASAADHLRALT